MTRILTATVLVVILAVLLISPPAIFALAIAAIVLLGWREYAGLAAALAAAPLRWVGPGSALICAGSFWHPEMTTTITGLCGVSIALGIIICCRSDSTAAVRRLSSTLCGLLWLGLLPGFQLGLRQQPEGAAWLVLLYASVSGGDIFAYYGGRRFGRRPLSPVLSPKKTVAGAIVGLLGSAVAGGLWALPWGDLAGGPVAAAAIATLLGAVGQVGDLTESTLKRGSGLKDSSTLLPGHGGLLDRIDGHLFAGAALYSLMILRIV